MLTEREKLIEKIVEYERRRAHWQPIASVKSEQLHAAKIAVGRAKDRLADAEKRRDDLEAELKNPQTALSVSQAVIERTRQELHAMGVDVSEILAMDERSDAKP